MTLPTEYDSRVKAMEVDKRPMEQYSEIRGPNTQIQELVEAIVLLISHKEKFENLRIHPPKKVVLYGHLGYREDPAGQACAARTKATFLQLIGFQLV